MKRTVFLMLSLASVLLVATCLFMGDMVPRVRATDARTVAYRDEYLGGLGLDDGPAFPVSGTPTTESFNKQTLGHVSQNEIKAKGIAAYKAYKDPVTGKFRPSPVRASPIELSEKLQNALSTSPEGLIEIQSPVPNGGTIVRLNGRFRNVMVATTDGEGNVSTQCLSTVPALVESNLTTNLATTSNIEEE